MLSSIGEMKANQLAYWYEDEMYDASAFSRNPLFARFIEEWLRSGSIADRTNLTDLLDVTADSHSYENILITDPHGELLLSFIPDIVEIDSIVVSTVRRAANEREIISTDLYKSSIHQTIYIDFLAPVVNDQEEPIAVLVLRIDPDEYVYPLIRSWPVPTETAEAYIFRKENDTVLFLNAVRHKDDAALRLRLSNTQTDLPAVQATLGYEGIFAGKDYRGVDVLADVRSIPGTPWFIKAKIDLCNCCGKLLQGRRAEVRDNSGGEHADRGEDKRSESTFRKCRRPGSESFEISSRFSIRCPFLFYNPSTRANSFDQSDESC